jgi:hypothetical protein
MTKWVIKKNAQQFSYISDVSHYTLVTRQYLKTDDG